MEVNCFQIVLIDVTFYLDHVQKMVLLRDTGAIEVIILLSLLLLLVNVLIINENPNICGTGG